MGYTFDGTNKRIILTTGTTSVDVADMYSRWKDWVLLSDNAKYLQALSVVGGDETPTGYIGSTFFLENGWRIRPQEANHTLTITGNLYVRGGGAAVVSTLGTYQVLTTLTVSNLVDTVPVGSGLSTDEHNVLIALPATINTSVASNLTTLNDVSTTDVTNSVTSALNSYNPPTKAELDSAVSGLATSTEVAKIPKSDGVTTWNTTALNSIKDRCASALVDYDPPTYTELLTRTVLTATYATSTELATVRAKTDNLPSDPADQSGIEAAISALNNLSSSDVSTVVSGLLATLNDISAAEVLSGTIEGSITLKKAISAVLSVLTGLASGGGTGTITFRNQADSKDRVIMEVDENGNRSTVTFDFSDL